jgi:hypothetical protein
LRGTILASKASAAERLNSAAPPEGWRRLE